MTIPPARYRASELVTFAACLFRKAGCDGDKPSVIAAHLVEADLMGHTTHGLQLASGYLEELTKGEMTSVGEPTVVADFGAAVTWDGGRLPGVWLTARAIDLAIERSAQHGIAAVVCRKSHHIACLATYLEKATSRGYLVILMSSDPSDASVAPFGGRKAVMTPNPIAVGIPTSDGPILIDMSASITTNGLTNRLRKQGRRYPGKWAMTSDGVPTDDPNALFTGPPGTLLPVGGKDHGHKGYGLALAVEALTQGLSGYGRAQAPRSWGASLFVQVLAPELFAGSSQFLAETTWLAVACRNNPPLPGVARVRLPGDAALRRKADALRDGVALYPEIMDELAVWADRFKIAPLTAIH
jgi:LDH2 family malate/lactate/ureidoglycolate dehydrogenase